MTYIIRGPDGQRHEIDDSVPFEVAVQRLRREAGEGVNRSGDPREDIVSGLTAATGKLVSSVGGALNNLRSQIANEGAELRANNRLADERYARGDILGGLAQGLPFVSRPEASLEDRATTNRITAPVGEIAGGISGVGENITSLGRAQFSPEKVQRELEAAEFNASDPSTYPAMLRNVPAMAIESAPGMGAAIAAGAVGGPMAAFAAEGIQAFGGADQYLRNDILELARENPTDFLDSPVGRRYLKAYNGDFRAAVEAAGDDVARKAAPAIGLSTGVLAKVIGNQEAALYGPAIRRGVVKAFLSGVRDEGLEETAQSAAERIIANVGRGTAKASGGNPLEGVVEDSIQGGLTGAFMGGPTTAGGQLLQNRAIARSPAPEPTAPDQGIASPYGNPYVSPSPLEKLAPQPQETVPPVTPEVTPAPAEVKPPETSDDPLVAEYFSAPTPELQQQVETKALQDLFQDIGFDPNEINPDTIPTYSTEPPPLPPEGATRTVEPAPIYGGTLFNHNYILDRTAAMRDAIGQRAAAEGRDAMETPYMQALGEILSSPQLVGQFDPADPANVEKLKNSYYPQKHNDDMDQIGEGAIGLRVVDTLPDGTQQEYYFDPNVETEEEARAAMQSLSPAPTQVQPEPAQPDIATEETPAIQPALEPAAAVEAPAPEPVTPAPKPVAAKPEPKPVATPAPDPELNAREKAARARIVSVNRGKKTEGVDIGQEFKRALSDQGVKLTLNTRKVGNANVTTVKEGLREAISKATPEQVEAALTQIETTHLTPAQLEDRRKKRATREKTVAAKAQAAPKAEDDGPKADPIVERKKLAKLGGAKTGASVKNFTAKLNSIGVETAKNEPFDTILGRISADKVRQAMDLVGEDVAKHYAEENAKEEVAKPKAETKPAEKRAEPAPKPKAEVKPEPKSEPEPAKAEAPKEEAPAKSKADTLLDALAAGRMASTDDGKVVSLMGLTGTRRNSPEDVMSRLRSGGDAEFNGVDGNIDIRIASNLKRKNAAAAVKVYEAWLKRNPGKTPTVTVYATNADGDITPQTLTGKKAFDKLNSFTEENKSPAEAAPKKEAGPAALPDDLLTDMMRQLGEMPTDTDVQLKAEAEKISELAGMLSDADVARLNEIMPVVKNGMARAAWEEVKAKRRGQKTSLTTERDNAAEAKEKAAAKKAAPKPAAKPAAKPAETPAKPDGVERIKDTAMAIQIAKQFPAELGDALSEARKQIQMKNMSGTRAASLLESVERVWRKSKPLTNAPRTAIEELPLVPLEEMQVYQDIIDQVIGKAGMSGDVQSQIVETLDNGNVGGYYPGNRLISIALDLIIQEGGFTPADIARELGATTSHELWHAITRTRAVDQEIKDKLDAFIRTAKVTKAEAEAHRHQNGTYTYYAGKPWMEEILRNYNTQEQEDIADNHGMDFDELMREEAIAQFLRASFIQFYNENDVRNPLAKRVVNKTIGAIQRIIRAIRASMGNNMEKLRQDAERIARDLREGRVAAASPPIGKVSTGGTPPELAMKPKRGSVPKDLQIYRPGDVGGLPESSGIGHNGGPSEDLLSDIGTQFRGLLTDLRENDLSEDVDGRVREIMDKFVNLARKLREDRAAIYGNAQGQEGESDNSTLPLTAQPKRATSANWRMYVAKMAEIVEESPGKSPLPILKAWLEEQGVPLARSNSITSQISQQRAKARERFDLIKQNKPNTSDDAAYKSVARYMNIEPDEAEFLVEHDAKEGQGKRPGTTRREIIQGLVNENGLLPPSRLIVRILNKAGLPTTDDVVRSTIRALRREGLIPQPDRNKPLAAQPKKPKDKPFEMYSPAYEAAKQFRSNYPQNRKQILKWLLSRSGVKKDEIRNLALGEWLAQGPTATGADLVDWIGKRRLMMEVRSEGPTVDATTNIGDGGGVGFPPDRYSYEARYREYTVRGEGSPMYRTYAIAVPADFPGGGSDVAHFGGPGTIAHFRVSEVANDDGTIDFHIEEIQSDYFDAKDEEFGNPETAQQYNERIARAKERLEEISKEIIEVGLKVGLIWNDTSNRYGEWIDENTGRTVFPEEVENRAPDFSRLASERAAINREINSRPSTMRDIKTPFRHTWPEAVFRHALRAALMEASASPNVRGISWNTSAGIRSIDGMGTYKGDLYDKRIPSYAKKIAAPFGVEVAKQDWRPVVSKASSLFDVDGDQVLGWNDIWTSAVTDFINDVGDPPLPEDHEILEMGDGEVADALLYGVSDTTDVERAIREFKSGFNAYFDDLMRDVAPHFNYYRAGLASYRDRLADRLREEAKNTLEIKDDNIGRWRMPITDEMIQHFSDHGLPLFAYGRTGTEEDNGFFSAVERAWSAAKADLEAKVRADPKSDALKDRKINDWIGVITKAGTKTPSAPKRAELAFIFSDARVQQTFPDLPKDAKISADSVDYLVQSHRLRLTWLKERGIAGQMAPSMRHPPVTANQRTIDAGRLPQLQGEIGTQLDAYLPKGVEGDTFRGSHEYQAFGAMAEGHMLNIRMSQRPVELEDGSVISGTFVENMQSDLAQQVVSRRSLKDTDAQIKRAQVYGDSKDALVRIANDKDRKLANLISNVGGLKSLGGITFAEFEDELIERGESDVLESPEYQAMREAYGAYIANGGTQDRLDYRGAIAAPIDAPLADVDTQARIGMSRTFYEAAINGSDAVIIPTSETADLIQGNIGEPWRNEYYDKTLPGYAKKIANSKGIKLKPVRAGSNEPKKMENELEEGQIIYNGPGHVDIDAMPGAKASIRWTKLLYDTELKEVLNDPQVSYEGVAKAKRILELKAANEWTHNPDEEQAREQDLLNDAIRDFEIIMQHAPFVPEQKTAPVRIVRLTAADREKIIETGFALWAKGKTPPAPPLDVVQSYRHPTLGSIDLPRGNAKYGQMHIEAKHGGKDAPDLSKIPQMKEIRRTDNGKYIDLSDGETLVVVATDYAGVPRNWIVTAYKMVGAEGVEPSSKKDISPPPSTGGRANDVIRPDQGESKVLYAKGKRPSTPDADGKQKLTVRYNPGAEGYGADVSGQSLNTRLPRMMGADELVAYARAQVAAMPRQTIMGESVERTSSLKKPSALSTVGGLLDHADKQGQAILRALWSKGMASFKFLDDMVRGYYPLNDITDSASYKVIRSITAGTRGQAQDLAQRLAHAVERSGKIGPKEALNIITGQTTPATKELADDIETVRSYLTTAEPESEAALLAEMSSDAIREVSKEIKDVIDEIGQQLVDHRAMGEKQYQRWRRQYLRRMYMVHFESYRVPSGIRMSGLDYARARKNVPGETATGMGQITDLPYLIYQSVELPLADMATMVHLRAMFKFAMTTPGNNWVAAKSMVYYGGNHISRFALSKAIDFNAGELVRKEKELKSNIDAYGESGKAITRLGFDITELKKQGEKMRKLMDQNPEYKELMNHRQLPDGYKQLPLEASVYGEFAGAVVKNSIFNDIMGAGGLEISPTDDAVVRISKRSLNGYNRSIKFLYTVANPPTHFRQLYSNLMQLTQSGVNATRFLEALYAMAQHYGQGKPHPAIEELIKHGGNKQSFTQQELRTLNEFADNVRIAEERANRASKMTGPLKPLHQAMVATTAMKNAVSNTYGKAASFLYQSNDTLSKLAVVIDQMERGVPPALAVIEANKWFFDYSQVPPAVRWLRNSPIAPFISYTYFSIGTTIETAATRPWGLVAPVIGRYSYGLAMTTLFMTMVLGMGVDGDDDDDPDFLATYFKTITDLTKGSPIDREAKLALQESMRKRPMTMPVMVRDSKDRHQWMDFSSTDPTAAALNAVWSVFKLDLDGVLGALGTTGGPLFSMAAMFKTGVDPFTQQQYFDSNDSGAEKMAARAEYLLRAQVPPGYAYYAPPVFTPKGAPGYEAMFGTGLDRNGEPGPTGEQMALRMAGVTMYGIDYNYAIEKRMKEFDYREKELKGKITRAEDDASLTEPRRQAQINELETRLSKLQDEASQYARDTAMISAIETRKAAERRAASRQR